MNRIENPEIKKYMIDFAVKTLGDCELFTKTFGKDFAKDKLALNFVKIYTNQKDRHVAGYYLDNDHSITLCEEGKNGNLLSIHDIEKDENLKTTILHEEIHAIAHKSEKECQALGIEFGTGLQENYRYDTELGRGLNEGLTNWICQKAGRNTLSYKKLTDIANEIELAIGADKTMQLYKGDIRGNVKKTLEMTENEIISFLAQADQIYEAEDLARKYNYIVRVLKNAKNDNIFISVYEKEQQEKELEEIQTDPLFANLEFNRDYWDFLESNVIINTLDSKIAYLEEEWKKQETLANIARGRVENKIFTKYFERDFEEIMESEEITEKDLRRFNEFYKLIGKDEETGIDCQEFMENFEEIKQKYFARLTTETVGAFANGNLSTKQFAQVLSIAQSFEDYSQTSKIINEISKMVYPENPRFCKQLIEKLGIEDLDEITKYSIIPLKSGEIDKCIYLKDDKFESLPKLSDSKFIKVNEQPKDVDDIFEFTATLEEDIQNAIKEFLELKDRIEREDPEAQINILDREIIVNSNQKLSYYLIEDGEILPAVASKPVKFNFAQDNLKTELPTVEKNSIFSKMLLKIKRKIFEKTADQPENIVKNNKRQQFQKRISDMSTYSQIDKRDDRTNERKKTNSVQTLEK